MKENKLIKAVKNPLWFFGVVLRHCFSRFMNDRTFIKLDYFSGMGKFPNLEKPTTYNEKLQWLKLNDIHPEYSRLVDKYEAKEYVRKILGDEFIIPTLGIWESFDEIDFETLPNQFVLKTTHDSGGVVVCSDKSKFDREAARKKLEKSLKHNYFYEHREYPYKDIRPRIIAEKYLEDESGYELKDYKIFCFNGEPKLVEVDFDRFNGHKRNVYDLNWNLIDLIIKFPGDKSRKIEKPIHFDEMLYVAAQLSKGIPHVRVDLYNVNGKIYFGELTFFHGSGMEKFDSIEWDYKLGNLIKLPQI